MAMSADPEHPASSPDPPTRPPGPLFVVGAAALLAAMAIDTVAVIGRHIGHTLLGSIELVQAAVLLASASALVGATIARKHATVHLVVNRVPARVRGYLERVSALMTAVFFLALATGCAWISWDLRAGQEHSEVLQIPYQPLRIVCACALVGASILLIRQASSRGSR